MLDDLPEPAPAVHEKIEGKMQTIKYTSRPSRLTVRICSLEY